jgi:hypothetical protein
MKSKKGNMSSKKEEEEEVLFNECKVLLLVVTGEATSETIHD